MPCRRQVLVIRRLLRPRFPQPRQHHNAEIGSPPAPNDTSSAATAAPVVGMSLRTFCAGHSCSEASARCPAAAMQKSRGACSAGRQCCRSPAPRLPQVGATRLPFCQLSGAAAAPVAATAATFQPGLHSIWLAQQQPGANTLK